MNRLRPWMIMPCGLLGGLTLGVVARLWMRLISTDHEYTRSGTIFIIGVFTIFCVGHSLVLFVRQVTQLSAWRTVARIVAFGLTLPMFVGAGGIMLPTVICGVVVMTASRWPVWLRVIICIPGLVAPAFIAKDIVGNFGLGVLSLVRILLMILIYGVVIRILRISTLRR